MNINRLLLVTSFACATILPACKKQDIPDKVSLNISGTIQIDPKLKNSAKDSDVIFLIARPFHGGPPIAVQKLTGKSYPYHFHLTPQNLMMPNAALDEPVNLIVRIDKDGDAMTKNPGDLAGEYEKNPVSLNSSDLLITVNQKIE
ncbi:MAG: hypothetical protein A3I11_04450 [Elusimicrobia bacterium RIFCSPLOWO2_02_FULL_39_32]|nr:MAG: hypothetical protein A3B80_03020 [Elusimicrobia bacterium RIFCSPHIGHO2_02_FULL_39_36]OGR92947.1 MAG: hypothetical protein A3I11_04450 [Elusimicrobia bacterium RIFCSPLOWO2_02_FULL_39_32]OGR99730.1 MAG: hypothetical protein A3G85_01810 [Elusimicrobia bacterium RIFCSPLOWO2_12_FULL_39_28]